MNDMIFAPHTPPSRKPRKPYTFSISPELIYAIKSRAGKIPHGGPQRNGVSPGEERVVFKMLKSTRETLNRCAAAEGITALALLHAIALTLREDPRYAYLFAEVCYDGQPHNLSTEKTGGAN